MLFERSSKLWRKVRWETGCWQAPVGVWPTATGATGTHCGGAFLQEGVCGVRIGSLPLRNGWRHTVASSPPAGNRRIDKHHAGHLRGLAVFQEEAFIGAARMAH